MNAHAFHIMIGGQAGQGLETMGQMLSKVLVRSSYQILAVQTYMSRIRGGHNTFSIFLDSKEVLGPKNQIDQLMAFNDETIALHKELLGPNGLILAGDNLKSEKENSDLSIPLREIVKDPILQNVVALGGLSCLLGLDQTVVADVVKDIIGKKHEELLQNNLEALNQGYTWAEKQNRNFFLSLPKTSQPEKNIMLSGNQAIALGAMAGGANFCSFYPMTPATGVALNLVSQSDEMGIVVEQAEDEIAAINMALGASFNGARSIVPTSGGGFALMSEGLSLSGMTETPVLIVLAQRPGPATGLPTRTEQGDLFLALYSGHGEFPRAVFSPGTPEECFYLTFKGLELAERYQTPVILLTDQYLADSFRSVRPFELPAWSDEGVWSDLKKDSGSNYQRYQITENGISPRRLPGVGKHLIIADSDEHTPDGHITEDLSIRKKMVDKRLAKMKGMIEEAIPPEVNGPKDSDLLLISWGSTKMVMYQAANQLKEQGLRVSTLHFSQVWPLNQKHFLAHIDQAKQSICIESNAKGQLASLLRQVTGRTINGNITRYDGLPIDAEYILNNLDIHLR